MIYLSLGTNVGVRAENLSEAIRLLNAERITVIRRSSVYETGPRDVLDQPWFLNMVLECQTKLFPLQLISKVLRVEKSMGRNRGPSTIRRGPRLIDIDVLLYRNCTVTTPQLTVPHPRMFERRFVLEPLLELAPKILDPRTNKPIRDFMAKVRDQSVMKIDVVLP